MAADRSLLHNGGVSLFPLLQAQTSSEEGAPSDRTIVLDDEPMLFDEGSLVVEDDRVVAAVDEPTGGDSIDDSWDDDDAGVIEVGDEVVFDG